MNHDVLDDQQDATPNFASSLGGSAGLAGYCAMKGGVRLVHKGGRDGMHGSWRQYQGQDRPSWGHRHADLDEDTSVRWEQRAD
jgi:hypothetical protein